MNAKQKVLTAAYLIALWWTLSNASWAIIRDPPPPRIVQSPIWDPPSVGGALLAVPLLIQLAVWTGLYAFFFRIFRGTLKAVPSEKKTEAFAKPDPSGPPATTTAAPGSEPLERKADPVDKGPPVGSSQSLLLPPSPDQEPPQQPVRTPNTSTGNVFTKHPLWWLVLVIIGFVFAVAFQHEAGEGGFSWAAVLGIAIGLVVVGFILTGIPYLVSALISKRMTSKQFMATFTAAVALTMFSRIFVADYEKKVGAENSDRERQQGVTQTETKGSPTLDYFRATSPSAQGLSDEELTLKVYDLTRDNPIYDQDKEFLAQAKALPLGAMPCEGN